MSTHSVLLELDSGLHARNRVIIVVVRISACDICALWNWFWQCEISNEMNVSFVNRTLHVDTSKLFAEIGFLPEEWNIASANPEFDVNYNPGPIPDVVPKAAVGLDGDIATTMIVNVSDPTPDRMELILTRLVGLVLHLYDRHQECSPRDPHNTAMCCYPGHRKSCARPVNAGSRARLSKR